MDGSDAILSRANSICVAFLRIHEFATGAASNAPELAETTDGSTVPLTDRFGSGFLLSYFTTYLLLYAALFLPQVAFIRSSLETQLGSNQIAQPGMASQLLGGFAGLILFAALQAWLSHRIVKWYHRKRATVIQTLSKPTYDLLYPKKLKRWLWIAHVIPSVYLTFIVVPVITHLQHMISVRVGFKRLPNLQRGESDSLPTQYASIQSHISNTLDDLGLKTEEVMATLHKLFERKVTALGSRAQYITTLLSSLGIVMSLVALMVKEPLVAVFHQGKFWEGLVVTSVAIGIAGLAVYFLSRLQSTISEGRDLRLVLDVLDIAFPE